MLSYLTNLLFYVPGAGKFIRKCVFIWCDHDIYIYKKGNAGGQIVTSARIISSAWIMSSDWIVSSAWIMSSARIILSASHYLGVQHYLDARHDPGARHDTGAWHELAAGVSHHMIFFVDNLQKLEKLSNLDELEVEYKRVLAGFNNNPNDMLNAVTKEWFTIQVMHVVGKSGCYFM